MDNTELTPTQDFLAFLDSVCTQVDTSKPLLEPERDYVKERWDKQQAHRHRWLLQNNFWYRQSFYYNQKQEQLRLELGDEYTEPATLTPNDDGFWDQFTER